MNLDEKKKSRKEKSNSSEDLDAVSSFLNSDSKTVIEDSDESSEPVKKRREVLNDEIINDDKPANPNKPIIIGSIVAVSVIVCAIIIFLIISNGSKEDELRRELEAAKAASANATQTEIRDVQAGAPNLNSNTQVINDSEISQATDLNGKVVETNYKIKQINTVRDYVSFKKFRTVTGTGLEFYYLDAVYKDNPYIIQVPYAVFKELENSGITLVDVEVTILEDNSQIVTYMDVVKNAKSIINGR